MAVFSYRTLIDDPVREQGAVIQSVLKAEKCKKLSLSRAADHEVGSRNSGSADIVHRAGIYRDAPLAYKVTDLDSGCCAKSKGHLKDPSFVARSFFWLEVPLEVKSDESNSAFYFKAKSKDVSTRSDDNLGDSGGQQEQESEEGRQEEMGEEDDEEGDEDSEEEEDEEEDEDADSLEDDMEDSEGTEEDVDFESQNEDSEMPEETEYPTTCDPASQIIKKSFPPFVNISDNGLKALGQFVSQQLDVFKYQHRTFYYSIYVCFDMARLLYFDHAGVHVSEAFSWVEPTSLLHEFVWKFAKLANANKLGDMGHNTTANAVSLATRRKFVQEA